MWLTNQSQATKFVIWIVLSLLGLSSFSALADSYPNKPVKIVIPYAAGGGSDAVSRIMSPHLKNIFNQ